MKVQKNLLHFGHGVYDRDTYSLLKIKKGEIFDSKILSISKSEYGIPGEIKGTIENDKKIGNIYKNTEFGIYGKLEENTNLKGINKMKIASRNEVEIGSAYILYSLKNGEVEKYNINIESMDLENYTNNRSMKIKIDDEELLKKTGGIICGMSGCPIIQNNKVIGVVTNVLVNNSEYGYGVFADLMIKEMIKK